MSNPEKKPVIGIIGGICSGKSTVAAQFEKLGCAVIDADKLAHDALFEPSVKKKITELFGDQILDSKGDIDRKKLGQLVFSDKNELSSLNMIIHRVVLDKFI